MSNFIDLTGKNFYRLKVIKCIGKNKHGQYLWECKCDCGNKKTISSNSLMQGHTKSCGCLAIEHMKELGRKSRKDLSGHKFGRLTVIRDTGERKGEKIIYECLCDCGKTKNVSASNLKSGQVQSCGCLSYEKLHDKAFNDASTERLMKNVIDGTNLYLLNDNIRSNNKSGKRGVSFSYKKEKWYACIGIKGKNINLGYYTKLEDAIKARKEAEEKLWNPILSGFKNQEGSGSFGNN